MSRGAESDVEVGTERRKLRQTGDGNATWGKHANMQNHMVFSNRIVCATGTVAPRIGQWEAFLVMWGDLGGVAGRLVRKKLRKVHEEGGTRDARWHTAAEESPEGLEGRPGGPDTSQSTQKG